MTHHFFIWKTKANSNHKNTLPLQNPIMLKTRKKTLVVNVDWVKIWDGHPIVIQSMTDTQTTDIEATLSQIKELILAWSELVRIAVPDEASAKAVPEIVKRLKEDNCYVPIVGDFHYNGHQLLNQYPDMAKALSKYRINPWNVWKWDKHDDNFWQIIKCAIKYSKPVRIGINGWSLDKDLLQINMERNARAKFIKPARKVFLDSIIESCILSVKKAEELGLAKNMIVVSAKLADVQELIEVNEILSEKTDCPLHLGLTHPGGSVQGMVASASGLSVILQQWIWDTIRVSITPEPWQPRTLEVDVCKTILQSMSFRYFRPTVVSCPGCWRTSSNRFQILSKQISDELEKKLPTWKSKYPDMVKSHIAVMWCVVNGIGEAEQADIAIFFPGNAEKPIIPVYIKWKPYTTFTMEDDIFEEFMKLIKKYFAGDI